MSSNAGTALPLPDDVSPMPVAGAPEFLRGRPRGTLAQFIRYIFVGGTAFVADFATLALLKESGLFGVLGAAALAFLVGTLVNYAISIRWVFTTRTLKNRRAEFALFAAVGLVGLGLNQCLIWLMAERIGLHYLLAKMISAGLVLCWNFFARKITLFRG